MSQTTAWTLDPEGDEELPAQPGLRFQLLDPLHQDEGGEWWLARDRSLLRLLRLRLAAQAEGERLRFAALAHPSVPALYCAGPGWYALRHAEQQPLLSPERALDRQVADLRLVCAGVARAHARGLSHGHLRAGLLRVSRGGPLVEGWHLGGGGGPEADLAALLEVARQLLPELEPPCSAAELAQALGDWLDGAPRRRRVAQLRAESQHLREQSQRRSAELQPHISDAERAWTQLLAEVHAQPGQHRLEEAERVWRSLEERRAQAEDLRQMRALADLHEDAAEALQPELRELGEAVAARLRAEQLQAEQLREEVPAARAELRLRGLATRLPGLSRHVERRTSLHLQLTEDLPLRLRLRMVDRRPVIWREGEAQELPGLQGEGLLDLPAGPLILELEAPDRLPLRLPLDLPPAGEQRLRLRLLRPGELPPDMVYVPAGPARLGADPLCNRPEPELVDLPGFFIGRHHITVEEYLAFLQGLWKRAPEQAWAHVPRNDTSGARHWPPFGPEGPLRPERDIHGLRWPPQLPIFSISALDAEAYARWAGEQRGLPLRLPRSDEWDKAARGPEGRRHPWGDRRDLRLSSSSLSAPGQVLPALVGAYPADRSVYGIYDAQGNVRDLCADGPQPGQRYIRGGAWRMEPPRLASRRGWSEDWPVTSYAFRLAMDLPPDAHRPAAADELSAPCRPGQGALALT